MKLDIPDSNETKVFRQVEALLKADPTLSRLIRPRSWFTWTGDPEEADAFTSGEAPAIRLTPVPGPDGWIGPEAMVCPLYITVDVFLVGTNADDLMNLWSIVRRVFYPSTNSAALAVQASLRAVGAETGVVTFPVAAHDPAVAARRDGEVAATAQLMIRVLKTINQ